MTYAFVDKARTEHTVVLLCRLLEVSHSGYYAWRRRGPSRRSLNDQLLLARIKDIHRQCRQNYGALKTWRVLQLRGEAGGKHRIARLRREHGNEARRKRRFRNAVRHEFTLPPAENLLQRRFHDVPEPNKVWVGDITYVATRRGWLYLAVLLDLYSRLVVGWAMGKRITRDLPLAALEMAVAHRKPDAGLLHHTDRGSQYASYQYRQRLDRLGFDASMSRKGNAWDNAVAESFFSNLKNELIHHQTFDNQDQARTEIFKYIERFYNRERAHAALNYMSPVEFQHKSVALYNLSVETGLAHHVPAMRELLGYGDGVTGYFLPVMLSGR